MRVRLRPRTAIPMLEYNTVSEKVPIMDALSAADEVKELSKRIDEILELLRIQNSLLCQLLPQSAKISSDLKELAGLESKLDAIDNALSILEEFVRPK
jgi:hypothetical protein